jgi:hypothetical protein
MKSLAALLVLVSLAGCATEPVAPPVPVEVKVAVPVPCDVPEPQCVAPAYDTAIPDMPGDTKVRLLRAEAVTQSDCLRQYRRALAACRQGPQKPTLPTP